MIAESDSACVVVVVEPKNADRAAARTLTCISRSRGSHLEAPHAGEPEAIDSRRKKGPWEGEEGFAVLFRGTKKYNECRRETNGTLFGRLTSLPCDKGNTFQALPTSGHDRAGIVAPCVTSRHGSRASIGRGIHGFLFENNQSVDGDTGTCL